MKQLRYTDKVIEHFRNPRRFGALENPDGTGQVGDAECGDVVRIHIAVGKDFRITDISFQARGCPCAIACASALTEMAIGKHVDDAWEITDEQIADSLGGLPGEKIHCSAIAAGALHNAIMSYVFKDTGRKAANV